MFKKNLYITKGVNENLCIELISIIWELLSSVNDRELDYLQVFEFKQVGSPDDSVIEITWSQEQPEHMEKRYCKGLSTDVEKVWVICSGENTSDEYSTMLLPEEY